MLLTTLMLQTAEGSANYMLWMTIFLGIIAAAFLMIGIVAAIVGVKVAGLVVDAKKFFDETKGKAMPLIAKATEITGNVQGIIADVTPKVKVVTENVVEISHTARQTVAKLDVTIRDAADKATATFNDANDKTKQQVARVDGMVSSTLTATSELGATVNHGIRTPARKIAEMVTQTKHTIDTLLDRAKTMGIDVGAIVQSKLNPKTKKSGW